MAHSHIHQLQQLRRCHSLPDNYMQHTRFEEDWLSKRPSMFFSTPLIVLAASVQTVGSYTCPWLSTVLDTSVCSTQLLLATIITLTINLSISCLCSYLHHTYAYCAPVNICARSCLKHCGMVISTAASFSSLVSKQQNTNQNGVHS